MDRFLGSDRASFWPLLTFYFYNILSWRPFWPCDLRHSNKLSFNTKRRFDIKMVLLIKGFGNRRSLKIVNDSGRTAGRMDDGH